MPCSGPRKRSRLRSLSTSLACRWASWWSGRASALYRGPSCWSRSETALARSSAVNSLALRLAFSSESGAKKVSVPMEAMACSSGFELEGRLGGHGDRDGGERSGVGLQAVAGRLQIAVRRGSGGGWRLLRGHGRGGYQHGGQFAAGQPHGLDRET